MELSPLYCIISNMKRIIVTLVLVTLLAGLSGCGGPKMIKGIFERKTNQTLVSPLEKINRMGYNHFVNGSILETIGDIYSANAQYAEALKYYPNSNEIRYSYAETFMKMRHFQKALDESAKIIPRDGNVWFMMAKCFRSLGRNDSSLIAYRKTVEFKPDELSAYYQLAASYEQSEDFENAIWTYENMARLTPNYKIYGQLGNLNIRAGHLDKAEEYYNESLRFDSTADNVKTYLGLSFLLEEKGDTARAHNYLKTAARLAPYDIMVQDKLLGYYQFTNQLDKAIAAARSMIDQIPHDTNLPQRLALIYFHADSLKAADSILSMLIDGGNISVINLYYAGRAALELKDLHRAKNYFSHLTVFADSVADGWLNLGWVYGLMDSSVLEITTYQKGLRHISGIEDSVRLLYAVAVTHERNGNFDLSVRSFEDVIDLSPNHAQAMNYLGYMLTDAGKRLEDARQLIERALEIFPDNGAYIDSYGWVLYKLGEYKRSLEELLRAYRLVKDDAVITEHIAEVYRSLGDIENAQIYLNRALELDPDNESLRERLER